MTSGMVAGGMMQTASMPGEKKPEDGHSPGAKLVSTYCVRCHVAPEPTLQTAKEWSSTSQRMHVRMEAGLRGFETPSDREMLTIVAYMQENARQ